MKKQNENIFEDNYITLSIISAALFSIYFIIGIFFINLTYLPQAFNSDGWLGIFIVLFYYILTSIVLLPILTIINILIFLTINKLVKYIYCYNQILGFIIYPAIMTTIPFLMIYCVISYVGKISSFDYYFLYFNTWVCSMLQYTYILKNMIEKLQQINERQSEFIKKINNVDYF